MKIWKEKNMSTCQGTEIPLVLTSVSNTGLVDILTLCSAFFLVFYQTQRFEGQVGNIELAEI